MGNVKKISILFANPAPEPQFTLQNHLFMLSWESNIAAETGYSHKQTKAKTPETLTLSDMPLQNKKEENISPKTRASKTVTICNRLGLHARAASTFVKTSSKYKSSISIQKDDLQVNGKSILGIMTLAAAEGSRLTLQAEGEDAQQAVQELALLIENRFGEEQ